ncbi:XRE family transcriptional regulator [Xanthomonas campestris]|uniref:XRE family transcriptional regulator n=1 Tax=Xanthomonas campestris TaxID=339 RepID=UPI0011C06238|nr:XRE family transcriptional regulator [Xanthomonas campestris]MEA9575681.1 XRE family transcriptional regulator [Xanthomonas campestris]
MTSFREYLAERGLDRDEEFMSELSTAVFALPLAALRGQACMSQQAVAKHLNKSQAAVSKFESRNDFLLSTFYEYVEAVGGKIDISISVADKSFGLKQERDENGSRYFCLEAKKAHTSKTEAVIKFASFDGRRRGTSGWQTAASTLAASPVRSSTYARSLLIAANKKNAEDEAQPVAA